MKLFDFPVVVVSEGRSFSSWCPELDVASQGETVEKALHNLKEALELHLECLDPAEFSEIKKRQQKASLDLLGEFL